MKSHTVHSFDEELESIRNRVMAMGGLTEQQLSDALTALVRGDSFLAEMVIEKDNRLNRMELDIDNACISLLARRTPVAFDLRLVISMIKTINDLERIGDLTKEISQISLTFWGHAKNRECLPLLEGMGEQVKKMLHKSLDALARFDAKMAAELYRDDLPVNHYHDAILQHMFALMVKGTHNIPNVLHICWITHALERIGDRCRNIGEYVIYLVEGRDIRHAESAHNPKHNPSPPQQKPTLKKTEPTRFPNPQSFQP
uniref:Phosphate-specific transport system accessory protein PhoU n=1 Tax=Candidatus Kentrum sp. MB TaxID=2138164 RepID=A0A450X8R3_9GAMM|nr:MAG: phosphate uptake regulator, PhoU [Candidatus Kentron sp. MB]VFK34478.1 MAG: phosphate uptake regulator, PhoU [Candidatus Kentron sp. MB]VFK76776.1 MAG: phosphate uptake regulator, PhoU [Candidatus Kentron sp. MB]